MTTKTKAKKYVALAPLHYQMYLNGKYNPDHEVIQPYPDDPFHPDAKRLAFEHLTPEEVSLLVIKGIIAEDKE